MVKSPFYVKSKPLTRADELRDRLNDLEAKIGRLGFGLGQEALSILPMLDVVSATLASFQAEGQGMRAEAARLETVSAKFAQKAKVFLREIGGARVLKDARRTRQPDPKNWWWFLDQLVVERRRARLRRWLLGGAAVVVALLMLAALYQRFLAPDPATRERLRHQQNAESLAFEGDLAGALSEVEQALASAPGNPNLLTFKGSLQQVLGQRTAAEETFAAAEAAFGDRAPFLLARGQSYLLLGQARDALTDAEELVALDPQSAAGLLLIGRSYESLGDSPAAIVAYEQAATVAEAQGDFQLAGSARVNAAMLLQRLQAQ